MEVPYLARPAPFNCRHAELLRAVVCMVALPQRQNNAMKCSDRTCGERQPKNLSCQPDLSFERKVLHRVYLASRRITTSLRQLRSVHNLVSIETTITTTQGVLNPLLPFRRIGYLVGLLSGYGFWASDQLWAQFSRIYMTVCLRSIERKVAVRELIAYNHAKWYCNSNGTYLQCVILTARPNPVPTQQALIHRTSTFGSQT